MSSFFTHTFYVLRSQKCKKTVKSSVSFALLGSGRAKAACITLVKSTPGICLPYLNKDEYEDEKTNSRDEVRCNLESQNVSCRCWRGRRRITAAGGCAVAVEEDSGPDWPRNLASHQSTRGRQQGKARQMITLAFRVTWIGLDYFAASIDPSIFILGTIK